MPVLYHQNRATYEVGILAAEVVDVVRPSRVGNARVIVEGKVFRRCGRAVKRGHVCDVNCEIQK